MSCGLYLDVHVPAAITRALRRRGIDVLTAQEDGGSRLSDSDLLDRAGAGGRLIFTMDRDFLAEAVRRQREELEFATVIYTHPLHVSIRRCIEDLELIADVAAASETRGQIVYLPLRTA